MAFSNETPYAKLPQWTQSDKPNWDIDVNYAFDQIDTLLSEQHDAGDETDTNLANLDTRVTNNTEAINDANTQITSLNEIIKTAEGDIDNLETEQTKVNNDIVDLQGNVSTLTNSIGTVENNVNTLSSQVSLNTNNINNLRKYVISAVEENYPVPSLTEIVSGGTYWQGVCQITMDDDFFSTLRNSVWTFMLGVKFSTTGSAFALPVSVYFANPNLNYGNQGTATPYRFTASGGAGDYFAGHPVIAHVSISATDKNEFLIQVDLFIQTDASKLSASIAQLDISTT